MGIKLLILLTLFHYIVSQDATICTCGDTWEYACFANKTSKVSDRNNVLPGSEYKGACCGNNDADNENAPEVVYFSNETICCKNGIWYNTSEFSYQIVYTAHGDLLCEFNAEKVSQIGIDILIVGCLTCLCFWAGILYYCTYKQSERHSSH